MSPRCSLARRASSSSSPIRSRASRASSPAITTTCPRAPSTWSARSRKPSRRPARWPPRRPEPAPMADHILFELVSPERLILSDMVEMVVVPGTEGNFGVLPGHAPLISTIRPGTIEIYEGHTVTRRIFIVGGIAEVIPDRCTVLADEAFPPEALDRAAIEAELQTIAGNLPSLREQVAHAAGTERERLLVELRHLERSEAVARARLE